MNKNSPKTKTKIHLPNVNVQCFSSNGKLPTSVLQATLIRAVGVADTVPSYLTSIRRSLIYEYLKKSKTLKSNEILAKK
jgi:hypothetical protein